MTYTFTYVCIYLCACVCMHMCGCACAWIQVKRSEDNSWVLILSCHFVKPKNLSHQMFMLALLPCEPSCQAWWHSFYRSSVGFFFFCIFLGWTWIYLRNFKYEILWKISPSFIKSVFVLVTWTRIAKNSEGRASVLKVCLTFSLLLLVWDANQPSSSWLISVQTRESLSWSDKWHFSSGNPLFPLYPAWIISS